MTEAEARPETVLVRFQFTNRKLIPKEIRKVERDEQQLQKKRKINNIKPGEHTEGKNVYIKPFIVQLFRLGYFLTDVHYYKNCDNGWNEKYILVLSFNRKIPSKKLLKRTVKQLSQLTDKDAWGYIHYYRNPNNVWSLTCLHRIPPEQIGDRDIGELFFEVPDEKEPEKYIYEKI